MLWCQTSLPPTQPQGRLAPLAGSADPATAASLVWRRGLVPVPPAWRGITAGVLPLPGSHVARRHFKTKARSRKQQCAYPSKTHRWIECTTEASQSPPITAAAAPTSGRSASAPPAPPSRTPCPQQAPTLRINWLRAKTEEKEEKEESETHPPPFLSKGKPCLCTNRRRRCCAPHERELLALVAIGLAVGRRAVGVVVLAGQDSLREVRMLHRRRPEPAPQNPKSTQHLKRPGSRGECAYRSSS